MKVNVLMDKNKTVKACFKRKKFNLTTNVDPIDGGTITAGGKFNKGTIVPVEAIASPDFDFNYWLGTGKWSGLGMCTFQDFENDIQILLDNGFVDLRIDIPDYQRTQRVADSKAMVKRTADKGARVIWGVSSNSNNNSDYTITAENWADFRQAILSAAQWAQDNGIYEFQLGNEEENHVDGTTITGTQLITNMKALAIEVKQIFTNGNVSYSTDVEFHDDWITAGKGDLDILAFNIYRGHDGSFNDNWKTVITDMVNAFGVNGTYITEFSLSWNGLDDYSEDEAVQAAAVSEMIDYIKASGMERACFFTWANELYGVKKDDGTYRQLWNSLLNSE